MKHTPINLDDMLEPEAAAKWLRLSKRDFLEKVRQEVIPVFPLGPKTLRFHPRTIIAHHARKSGIPLETIAASFGFSVNRK